MNDQIYERCKEIDFPLTRVSPETTRRSYQKLCYENLPIQSNCMMSTILTYHPSIWKCHRRNHLSPFDAWYDEDLLKRSINNRLKYKGEDLSPIDIRAGFSISGIAPKVSVFRPSLSKYLVNKYLSEFSEIFDPCSGFSGRLLGVTSLGKKYIGQDINSLTVSESKNLISDFKLNADISVKNSICSKGSYECLFTCPPYADLENWNQDIEELSSEEWIDICLKNYNCKKYVFVVDNPGKYIDNVAEKLESQSHLAKCVEYVVVISK